MGRRAEVSLYRLFKVEGTHRYVRIVKKGRGWVPKTKNKTKIVTAGIRNARANGKKLGRPMRAVDRDLILRMRAEGQSLQHIAEILGIGYGTVRERLRGGLAKKPTQQAGEKAPN